MKKYLTFSYLRIIVLIVIAVGALGSVVLTLHAGRNNHSLLLPILFVIWVLSPFIALLAANVASRHWAVITRMALYCLAPVITIGSLMSYSGVFSPPGMKHAAIFLIVPLLSWLIIIIVSLVAALMSRKQSH